MNCNNFFSIKVFEFSSIYTFIRLHIKDINFKQKFNKKIDICNSVYYKITVSIVSYTTNLDKNFFAIL